jgi:hypothetical protein
MVGKTKKGIDVWDVVNPIKDVIDTFIPGVGFVIDLVRNWLDAPKREADEFRAKTAERKEKLKNLSPTEWNEIYKDVLGDKWQEITDDDPRIKGEIYGAVMKQADDEYKAEFAEMAQKNKLIRRQYEGQQRLDAEFEEANRPAREAARKRLVDMAKTRGFASVEEMNARDRAEEAEDEGSREYQRKKGNEAIEDMVRRNKKARELGVSRDQVDKMEREEAMANELKNPKKIDPAQLEVQRRRIINDKQLSPAQKEVELYLVGVPNSMRQAKIKELQEKKRQSTPQVTDQAVERMMQSQQRL